MGPIADLTPCTVCREWLPPDLLDARGVCDGCRAGRRRRRLGRMDCADRERARLDKAARDAAYYAAHRHAVLTRQRQRRREAARASNWPTPRHGQRWTHAEACYVTTHITSQSYGAIARALGRTTRAVSSWCAKHGHHPARMHLLTTTELADEWGCTVQYVARLARAGRIPGARRMPNSARWLYDPARLPEPAGGPGRD